jgi:hypothetical protein
MVAIKNFCELVVGGAYTFKSVNQTYPNDFELLKQTYDHYVHYNWVNVFNRERADIGRHTWDEERKVLQTSRERVSHCIFYHIENDTDI